MLSLRLTLGLVGALVLLGCGPHEPDEFDDAVRVCDTFKRTGMITECSLRICKKLTSRFRASVLSKL